MPEFDPPLEAILLRWPERNIELQDSEPDEIEALEKRKRDDAAWCMIAGSILQRGAVDIGALGLKWPAFFDSWPSPAVCASDDPMFANADQMISWLEGIHGRREKVGMIRRLARVWETRRPPLAGVASLPGCRIREADAYRIFVLHENHSSQDPVFSAWVELREHYGWSFEDESVIVEEALNARLRVDGRPFIYLSEAAGA
jgi:hypothetical protein